jgi:hypothetical protein
MTQAAAGLLPGDSITFILALKNDDSQSTDWWMTNKVLSSFEDNSVANGGAYTYELIYTGADGTQNILYSSETVGGDTAIGGEGLHEATGALEDYFYLDTLGAGQSGSITLEVALDGETQGNDYQNTLASLQLNFAVELSTKSSGQSETVGSGSNTNTAQKTTTRQKAVKTGDDTQLLPYVIGMAVSGVIVLIVAILILKKSKKEQKKGGSR